MPAPTPTDSAVQATVVTTVRRLIEDCEAPVAFGGAVNPAGDGFGIVELAGTHGRSLSGLQIRRGEGLGGKALAMGRPMMVHDYFAAKGITHAYDQAVAPERLRGVVAIPLRVGGDAPRAMVYAAHRSSTVWGESFLRRAVSVARAAERDLATEADVRRRIASGQSLAASPEIQELHAELDAITRTVSDPELRDRLTALCDRFASVAPRDEPGPGSGPVQLAPREIDVLTEVSLGGSNAEVARHLGLRATTVKSYLQSAMRKLEAANRVHAVHRARQLGLVR